MSLCEYDFAYFLCLHGEFGGVQPLARRFHTGLVGVVLFEMGNNTDLCREVLGYLNAFGGTAKL
ncbi:hypothetical protein [Paenibacillus polymyxa]|uniref:hypothetical protein n=1 Tax=Paenibacillus polymyxa TaxID=1406 RepID=UPI00287FED4B|nr:hypothetical protein [Paenibacillus polymyxa]